MMRVMWNPIDFFAIKRSGISILEEKTEIVGTTKEIFLLCTSTIIYATSRILGTGHI